MDEMKFKTKNGYLFFEVSSAFQKAVRRNEEESAMYFGVELFNSGYDEYLWKRIKIISSEDIGLASPQMPILIAALYENYTAIKKEKKAGKPERIFLVHAILQLCRAKKSRLVDYALMNYWRSHDKEKLPIPDYALDQHTSKGKQMGRGVDHFFNEGAFLINHVEQEFEASYKKKALHLCKTTTAVQFTNFGNNMPGPNLFNDDVDIETEL